MAFAGIISLAALAAQRKQAAEAAAANQQASAEQVAMQRAAGQAVLDAIPGQRAARLAAINQQLQQYGPLSGWLRGKYGTNAAGPASSLYVKDPYAGTGWASGTQLPGGPGGGKLGQKESGKFFDKAVKKGDIVGYTSDKVGGPFKDAYEGGGKYFNPGYYGGEILDWIGL